MSKSYNFLAGTSAPYTSVVFMDGASMNVGIGSTAPSVKLDVSGAIAATGMNATGVVMTGAGSVTEPSHTFRADSNTGLFNPAADMLAVTTGGVERMRVLDDGKVAIGSTTAVSSSTFSVTGTQWVTGNTTVAGVLTVGGDLIVNGTTTTVNTQTMLLADNLITINASLSNNTAPPSTLLSGIEVNRGLAGSNYLFAFQESTQLFKVGLSNQLQAVATRPDTVANNAIGYYNTSLTQLAFDSTFMYNGTNVGIGTVTPSGKLHVVGTTMLNGLVGVGTAPPTSAGLHVNTNVIVGTAWGAATAPTNGMIIQGNVGIGTSDPGVNTLHVQGTVYASGDITALSDRRVKDDIVAIPDALDKVSKIGGYTFIRRDEKEELLGKRYAGVIAQEVQAVLPEVISTDSKGTMSVAYGNIVALLVEAIKELKAKNEKLEAMVAAL